MGNPILHPDQNQVK